MMTYPIDTPHLKSNNQYNNMPKKLIFRMPDIEISNLQEIHNDYQKTNPKIPLPFEEQRKTKPKK